MHPSLDTGDDSTGGFGSLPGKDKEPRWDEKIRWLALPDDGEPYSYRLLGKPSFFFNHWVTTKKRDGNWGKPFAVLCKNYDSSQGKFVENGCKVCEFYRNMQKIYGDLKMEYAKWPDQIKKIGARSTMSINAISRELQVQGAPPGAADWTYIFPIKLPKGFAEKITDKARKFNRKPGAAKDDEKGFFGFNHADHGKDLMISYNSQNDAQNMYDLEIGALTPLTDAEREQYAKYATDFVSHLKYMTDNKVEELLQRGGYYDMLQSIQAQTALEKAQARVGLNTAPPPAQDIPKNTAPPAQTQTAPPAAATQQTTVPTSLDTGDDGGMTATEDELPNIGNQAAHSTQAAQPAPPPVQAPAQAAAPAAAPAAAANVAKEPGALYAVQIGRAVKVVTQDVGPLSLRVVRTGSEVPECFSLYSKYKAQAPEVCKGCPIKLDCMQAEA